MNKGSSDKFLLCEEHFQAIFDSVNDAILIHDSKTGEILDVNRRMCDMYGYSREETRHLTIDMLSSGIPPFTGKDSLHWMTKAVQGEPQLFEWHARDKSGRLFWAEVNMRNARIENRECILVTIRDITDRKCHEREIERLNCLYEALNHVNLAIVRVASRNELFREVNSALVEFGRFKMVWIGMCNPYTHEVEVVAKQGDDSDYLDGIRVSADDCPTGRGPTGTAIREKRPYVCNDFLNDPRTHPWRERAAIAGWRSSAAFPIHLGGEVCGALTVYDREVDFFGEREVELLVETALNISFGLDNLEREALRKQAVEALRNSEEKFRSIYENAPIAIYQSTPDGRFLSVNPATAHIFGYDSPEEMLSDITNIPDQIFVHPEQRREILDEVLRSGKYAQYEVEYFRKDGSIIVTNLHIRAVNNSDGSVYLEGFAEDITDLKRAVEAVRAQFEQISTIFDELNAIVLVVDPITRNLLYLNRYGTSLFGDDWQAKPCHVVIHCGLPQGCALEEMEYPARKGGLNPLHLFQYTNLLTGRIYQCMEKAISWVDGRQVLLSIAFDITDLKEIVRMQDDLLASVNHEIRTPLTAICGYTEFLLENRVDEAQLHEFHGIILKESQRLIDMLNNLLEVKGQHTGGPSLVHSPPLSLRPVLEEAAALFAEQTTTHLIGRDFPPDLPFVHVSREHILRILNILLSNAVKFSPNAKKVTLGACCDEGGTVTIWVRDEGIGIPPEVLKKIFDKFYQVDRGNTRSFGGVGLGLSVLKDIVAFHGGSVRVDSAPGKGSTFFVSLPVAQSTTGEL